jgi:hypothetical protein
MGIFDSLVQGEESGMPTGILNQSGWRGALEGNNAMMNIGLGILANNSGNYGSAMAALGKGAQQGVQNTQTSRQAQQQAALYKLKMAQAQKELEDADKLNKYGAEFKTKYPELAGYYDIDPKGAYKMANPQASGADPYTEVIFDDQGQGWLNNRRETDASKVLSPIMINGKPFIGARQSPELAGRIKGAEAQAGAAWKPNTNVDGMVLTDEQVSNMARGGQPAPFTQSAPQQMPQQSLQPYGIPPQLGGGIRVPTKLDIKQGEANIDVKKATDLIAAEDATKSRLDLPKMVAQSNNTIKLVDDLIAHKGLDTATGLSSKIDPRNYIAGTDATNFNIRLDQLKGQQFMEAYQTLKGGGQITEVEGKKATDAISRMNTAGSKDEFVKAAREFQDVIKTGVNRAKMKAGGNIMPSNEKMPTKQQKSVLKGQVYKGHKFLGGDPSNAANWVKQ